MDKNNYKRNYHIWRMKKRAQTTAYIIVAVVIVVIGIIVYFLYPRLGELSGGGAEPGEFMRTCVEPELEKGMELLSKQGGYANPEGYILYQNEKIKYLCYTSHYYVPCYVQQPLLVKHVELELEEMLQGKASECADELREYYGSRGYEVGGSEEVSVDVSIAPNRVDVSVEAPMSFTKETTQEFRSFKFTRASQFYSLLITATSIIDFESTYGDSEVLIYMRYYPELQIRKTNLIDGSTVYNIKNVKTSESFSFASRSLAWPAGLGVTA